MNEVRQARALFDAFLARFFENEMSDNSRDMKSSFLWILAILAAPGLLLPFSRMFDWQMLLAFSGYETLRQVILADKVMYLSFSMGGIMLLSAVVWQALLVDRRDAIVLGSFPVRPRVIVAAKIAALLAYVGIVGGGMHVVAAVAYGLILATSSAEILLGILGHFLSGFLACVFVCVTVAALQAAMLAVGGPRLFARLTAPAQLVLAAAGLLLFLLCPMIGAAAVDFARGNDRSAWVLWMPPVWFLGVYEVMLGFEQRAMPQMAARALYASGAMLALLLAAYPLAYRRIATSAIQGSPLGTRRSIASVALDGLVRRMPVRPDTRGALHFILLTIGRVARHKLVIATAIGAAVAITLPFVLRWAAQAAVPPWPGRSHIAVPFVFVMLGLAGTRMAYNVPSERAAGWIFSTAHRQSRIGTSAARLAGLLIGAGTPALVCLMVYMWFWGPAVAAPLALTVFTFGALVSEMGIRTVDFVPFTRAYNPDRSNLQARWPLYLIVTLLFLQFLPWAIRSLLVNGHGFLAPAALGLLALALRYAHPPEPPELIDADHENKPLALRLF
ncbi:MAG TPA: hypothetical protein VMN81_06375 [Vicinamibacterales bacterium]|nr:hypothetical protein [Vicinamibacterales bacterium]